MVGERSHEDEESCCGGHERPQWPGLTRPMAEEEREEAKRYEPAERCPDLEEAANLVDVPRDASEILGACVVRNDLAPDVSQSRSIGDHDHRGGQSRAEQRGGKHP